MKIFEYSLAASESQQVGIQQGARVLYVTEQNGSIVVYAHVIPDRPLVSRQFWIHGTGHDTQFSENAQSLGVVSFHHSTLMFHVFVEPEGWVP